MLNNAKIKSYYNPVLKHTYVFLDTYAHAYTLTQTHTQDPGSFLPAFYLITTFRIFISQILLRTIISYTKTYFHHVFPLFHVIPNVLYRVCQYI